MKLLFITFLAFLWFFVSPIYDIFWNHSKQNTAILHWLTTTTTGEIFFIVGGLAFIHQSVRWFIPKKDTKGKGLKNPEYKLPCDR